MDTPEQCITLMCNVSDIVGSASVDIYGFIDERFYNVSIYNSKMTD